MPDPIRRLARLAALLLGPWLVLAGCAATDELDARREHDVDAEPRAVAARTAAAPAAAPADALPDPLAAGWQGASVCEVLHEDAQLRVLRCTFAPGVGHERHWHPPHWGYVLAGGRMRITDASGVREVELTTGGSWRSDGVDWHEVLNIGDTTSAYLVVEAKAR